MSAIIDFFDQLGQFIADIVDFLTTTIQDMFRALGILDDGMQTLTEAVDYLPDFLKAYALVTITLISVLFILNRQGGKSRD